MSRILAFAPHMQEGGIERREAAERTIFHGNAPNCTAANHSYRCLARRTKLTKDATGESFMLARAER